jgi:hypothetical protein
MTEKPVGALAAELGAEPPGGLVAALSSDDLAALAAEVRDAKRRQAEALARAGDEALGHLPRLIRMAVERMLR